MAAERDADLLHLLRPDIVGVHLQARKKSFSTYFSIKLVFPRKIIKLPNNNNLPHFLRKKDCFTLLSTNLISVPCT
jgi:hypothetical protein